MLALHVVGLQSWKVMTSAVTTENE